MGGLAGTRTPGKSIGLPAFLRPSSSSPRVPMPRAWRGDLPTAAERIAEAFNECFANFEIRIEAGDVVLGTRRQIHEQGWRVTYRVVPDDGGFPSLEFHSTHRMTGDRHARIWADGHVQAWMRFTSSTPTTQRCRAQRSLRKKSTCGITDW